MICIDDADLKIFGDYNSDFARQLNIQLKKCEGAGCKNETEIMDFFKNKFLLLLVNEAQFITNGFGEHVVMRESRAYWLRINTFMPIIKPFVVSQAELVLQDELFNFADLTMQEENNVFTFKEQPNQSQEKKDGTQFEISFERDLDLQIYSRSGYTLLDLIANVGGLRTIMAFVIGQFINYWSFNSPQNYMVSRLFTYKRKDKDSGAKDQETKKINGATFGLHEYIRGLSHCCFKRKTDNQKSLDEGRTELDKETFIVRVVQNQRFFISALQELLTQEQKTRLRKDSELRVLDLDQISDAVGESKDCEDADP